MILLTACMPCMYMFERFDALFSQSFKKKLSSHAESSFFFSVFTSTHSSMLKHKQDSDTPSKAPHFSHLDSLIQLEPAVNLLIESVRGSIGDKHSLLFGKQILDTSLDFLYELLLDSLSVSESMVTEQERTDLQQATGKTFLYFSFYKRPPLAFASDTKSRNCQFATKK